jgi:hypothetical protein
VDLDAARQQPVSQPAEQLIHELPGPVRKLRFGRLLTRDGVKDAEQALGRHEGEGAAHAVTGEADDGGELALAALRGRALG